MNFWAVFLGQLTGWLLAMLIIGAAVYVWLVG